MQSIWRRIVLSGTFIIGSIVLSSAGYLVVKSNVYAQSEEPPISISQDESRMMSPKTPTMATTSATTMSDPPEIVASDPSTSTSVNEAYTSPSDSKANQHATITSGSNENTKLTVALTEDTMRLETAQVIEGTVYYPAATKEELTSQVGKKRNVYLENDINFETGGIELFDGFKLYGKDLVTGNHHQLNLQNAGNATTSTFYTSTKADITFSNLKILGGNQYGIIYYPNNVTGTIFMEQIDYMAINAQPFYGNDTLVHIKDSTFVQQKEDSVMNGGQVYAKNFMTGNQLVLEGRVQIDHKSFSFSSTAPQNDNPFIAWGKEKSTLASFIKVLENADVTVNTEKTLIFTGPGTPESFALEVAEDARFDLGIGAYFFSGSPRLSNDFIVAARGSLLLTDNSKQYGRALSNHFIPLLQEGTFRLAKDSNVNIYSDNTKVLIEQLTTTVKKPFTIPGDIGQFVLENQTSLIRDGFFALNSYLQTSGNTVVFSNSSFIGDHSQISFALNSQGTRQANVLQTNNNYDTNPKNIMQSRYNAAKKVTYLSTDPSVYRLTAKPIYANPAILEGTALTNTTVAITYQDVNGVTQREQTVVKDGTYRFDLKNKIRSKQEVLIQANIGGQDSLKQEYTPVTDLKETVIDNIPPSATAVFQKISSTAIESNTYDYRQSLDNIQDDSLEEVTIEVLTPFTKTVELQQATLRLTDTSGNRTDIGISAFIYDDDSVVEMEEPRYLLNYNYFEVYDDELRGETSPYEVYLQALPYTIWSQYQTLNNQEAIIVSSTLASIPRAEPYEVKLKNKNIEYSVYIKVKEAKTSPELIDVTVPTNMFFYSLGTSPKIYAPDYYFINNSSRRPVELVLQPLKIEDADGTQLTGEKRNLFLDFILDGQTIDSLDLENQTISLAENQQKVFSLTGEYLGPVDRIRRPTYKLELTIK